MFIGKAIQIACGLALKFVLTSINVENFSDQARLEAEAFACLLAIQLVGQISLEKRAYVRKGQSSSMYTFVLESCTIFTPNFSSPHYTRTRINLGARITT